MIICSTNRPQQLFGDYVPRHDSKANFKDRQGKQYFYMQMLHRSFLLVIENEFNTFSKNSYILEMDNTLLCYISTSLMFNKLAYVQICFLEFA
jgi:hypothetical protein